MMPTSGSGASNAEFSMQAARNRAFRAREMRGRTLLERLTHLGSEQVL